MSGQAALDHVQDSLTRVLRVDLGMPDIDGLEVARRLQAHPRRRAMLLIAITGYGQYRDVSDALEAGFDHHWIKPVDVIVLSDLIERWYHESAARGDRLIPPARAVQERLKARSTAASNASRRQGLAKNWAPGYCSAA